MCSFPSYNYTCSFKIGTVVVFNLYLYKGLRQTRIACNVTGRRQLDRRMATGGLLNDVIFIGNLRYISRILAIAVVN